MKYFIGFMLLVCNAETCEKCLADMEQALEVMQYYHDFSETDHWRIYTNGVIWGLQMGCTIHSIHHDLAD